jgi:BirA family biotin operon repressor/biotin-[acetyl-CoA-carboxylase] ligase
MNFSATPSDTWELPTRRLGRRTIVFDRLDSTNTYAASQADDPANDGLVVIAREQTTGRGQHGRTWQAPAGSSVLLSVLVFPPPALRRPAVLTAWAAVSVCETIRGLTGLQAQIKWPNDVLIHGRKVCGILIEQKTVASCQLPLGEPAALAAGSCGPHPAANAAGSPARHWQLATICGIGLNVNQTSRQFAAAGLEQAGSLAIFNGHEFDCDDTARLLIQQLDAEYSRLLDGDLALLEASWKRWLGLLGKFVAAECPNCEHHGRLCDVSWDSVLLDTQSGPVRLLPETVRHLRPV